MRVILDTSAIIGAKDWFFSGPHSEVLVQAAERREIDLLVPEVVIMELVGAQRRALRKALTSLDSCRDDLERLTGSEPPNWDPTASGSYLLALLSRLNETKIRRVDIPEVPHKEIVERAVARHPPFDKEGKVGYRDALIWHSTVEELASGDSVVLVTNDGDLADRENHRLRPELVEELRPLGIDPKRATVALSLKEAAFEVVTPSTNVLDELRARLASDTDWASQLLAQINEVALAEADSVEDDGVEVDLEVDAQPFAHGVVDQWLEDIEDVDQVEIVGALPLDDGQFLTELHSPTTVLYDVELSTSTFFDDPGAVPSGVRLSSDESRATFSGSADVVLVFDAKYDGGAKELKELRLQRLSPRFEGLSAQEIRRRSLARRKREARARRPW